MRLFAGDTNMNKISNGPAAKGTLTRRFLPATVAALAVTFASSAAFAQLGANCTSAQPIGLTSNGPAVAGSLGQSSAALAGAISSVETAFLSQQGSAFVSAPPNPVPNQPGGGVWVRGVGGEADVKSNSSTVLTGTTPGGVVLNQVNTNCNNRVHLSFGGVQIGADIARLNWNGWNVHLGSTVGYVGARTNDTNQAFPFTNDFQVPFLGTYLVATKGRFFADVMFREEEFNINLFNAGYGFSNQPLSGHGFSVTADAGYNFDLKNGWFIEPSGGFIFSRTAIDPFTMPGNLQSAGLSATESINDIESELGRLSLRFGKNIAGAKVNWQPFASVSVFHEFAGNTTATGTFPAVITNTPVPGVNSPINGVATNSTSRIGTYGQYSLGLAGQVVNTGWLGYVRADYKNGDNITGWGLSGGVRYQFTPEMIAAVMPFKVKAPPHPYIAPTNWTGFYVGAIGGADYGRTDVTALTTPAQSERPWVAGGLGGFELGYNRQLPNNWVLGVEGDIVGTNTHGARNLPPSASAGLSVPSASMLQVGDNTNWIATVAGKLGYAMGRTLYYVKAGGAFEDSRITVTCFDPINGGATCTNQNGFALAPPLPPGLTFNHAQISTSQTRAGWTAGFGTEFDLGKGWSAKSEVDFLDFGRHTALSSNGVTSLSDWNYLWQGKIGVNYHFSPSPVVAKY